MLATDIIKPEPKTELELHNRWRNYITSLLISHSSFSKKIKVINPNEINCTGAGRTTCLRQGEHSWFNHAMDAYYTNNESNLPPGFIEP